MAVIPAKAGIQTQSLRRQGLAKIKKHWIPRIMNGAGSVKPGMTGRGQGYYR
jgi:hypothetical protein